MEKQPQTMTTDEFKNWVPAKPLPYYSSFLDKIRCFFGKHSYIPSPDKIRKCYKCSKS